MILMIPLAHLCTKNLDALLPFDVARVGWFSPRHGRLHVRRLLGGTHVTYAACDV